MDPAVTRALMLRGDVPGDLAELIGRPAWHRRASCRSKGTDAFFLGPGQSSGAAKAMCSSYPVRGECLTAAMSDPELQGVWAGTSDRERRMMRRALRTPAVA